MIEPDTRQQANLERAREKRLDPVHLAFESVFDSVFDSVSTLFRETGSIYHQIVGLSFRSGGAHGTHIELVKVPDTAPVLIERMRSKCGSVAHEHFAKNLPDNIPGLSHPERRTLAVIEIHDAASVATAYCRVSRSTRELTRGVLSKKDATATSLKRPA